MTKVALITAGGSGMGADAARRLRDDGFEVGILSSSGKGEALVAEDGGDFSIKLEDQVLITEDGFENLTQYPFDAVLMGG